MAGFPLLSALWLLPLAGAGVVILLPGTVRQAAKWLALLVGLATLGLAVAVTVGFDSTATGAQFQFVESHRWIPAFGAGYTLGVDGIAVVLVLLTAGLVPLLMLAGWNDGGERSRGPHGYAALTLTVESMVLMSLVSLDILLFYVLFEAMLIPMYFMIGGFGTGAKRSQAALKFLLYNLFGGLIMMAAVIGVYVVTARHGEPTFNFQTVVAAFAPGSDVDPGVLKALFLGFMFAFAVKAPLWPFHRWLPDAAVEATPATAVLMMAVMDKVGTFGMLRYCLQLFPDAATYFRPGIIVLAVIGVVYGAMVAIGQPDIMRLIAYTSISHFGFIILGIFVMTSQGQSGSTLYMVNHGLSTAAVFLIAGFLISRRGGARLISAYGGVQKVAPVLAGTFLVAAMATLSLPGLAPFISEFLVLLGTFDRYWLAAVIGTTALVLSSIYMLWLYQRVMTGPVSHGNERLRDLVPREVVVVAPLLALLLFLGFYPKPVLDIINPGVSHTMTTIGQTDPIPLTAEGAR